MIKKKYFIALILFICCISQQATAMHGLIFRAVQVITSGNLIGGGAMISFMRKKYYDNYNVQRGINEGLVIPASETVKRYVHKKLNECNISNSSEVPVIVVENPKETWAVFCDRVIQVGRPTAEAIESGDMKTIAEAELAIKHEIKHMLNKDDKKKQYAVISIPCFVQAVGSGLTYGFNTIFKRQIPKTGLSCLGRSFMAVGAIVPKAIFSILLLKIYMKHQEIEADQFAVQRAKSREELMAYKNFFDEAEEHNINFMMGLSEYKNASEKKRDLMMSKECFFKTDHPRPKVRAAMIQKYIDKWDAEHKS